MTLNAGKLNINNAQALGTATGTFTIAGGTIDTSTSGGITTLNYPQAWNGDFTFAGTYALNLGTGPVTLSGDRQVTVSANTLTVGGVIGDGGHGYGLTLAGAGTLVLGRRQHLHRRHDRQRRHPAGQRLDRARPARYRLLPVQPWAARARSRVR